MPPPATPGHHRATPGHHRATPGHHLPPRVTTVPPRVTPTTLGHHRATPGHPDHPGHHRAIPGHHRATPGHHLPPWVTSVSPPCHHRATPGHRPLCRHGGDPLTGWECHPPRLPAAVSGPLCSLRRRVYGIRQGGVVWASQRGIAANGAKVACRDVAGPHCWQLSATVGYCWLRLVTSCHGSLLSAIFWLSRNIICHW